MYLILLSTKIKCTLIIFFFKGEWGCTDGAGLAGNTLGHCPSLASDAASCKVSPFLLSRILGTDSSALLYFHDLSKRPGARVLKDLFYKQGSMAVDRGRAEHILQWEEPKLSEEYLEARSKVVSLSMVHTTAMFRRKRHFWFCGYETNIISLWFLVPSLWTLLWKQTDFRIVALVWPIHQQEGSISVPQTREECVLFRYRGTTQ